MLWLTFLVGTFFVGFFHGSSPEKQINFYYQDIKKVDILVHQEGIISPAVVKYLEKETHTEINLIVRKSFKDFRTEIIVNKNLFLLLFPEAFVDPLYNDNRIKNIDSLNSMVTESVHSDFQPVKHKNQIYSLPIAWFVNVFSPTKKGSRSVYIDNTYLLNQKVKNHFFLFNRNYILEKNWTHTVPTADIYETTLQIATENKIPYVIDPMSSFLTTYSLGVPNNTPDRKLSLEAIRLILISKELKSLLADNNLGQTFLSPKLEYSVAHFIAPESIRNLNLNNFKNANKFFEEISWNNQALPAPQPR